MGTLIYDSAGPIFIEDRALAHLRAVIMAKLRRNESFSVSWQHADGDSDEQTTIWVHPAIPIRFVLSEPLVGELNRKWLSQLVESANEHGGIVLTREQIDPDG
ncbi:DUF7882 family protein [Microbacterium sp. JZ31]|uniref:DUF7882 family protein n=1 Tax=Microbacterium sp. JZ31 TaxID=1906274 RepID=UPI001933BC4D|nr:hypothetical protein [Microbacterium sp. JZ31]